MTPLLHPRSSLPDPWRAACEWRSQGYIVWDTPSCRHLELARHATVYTLAGEPRQVTAEEYNLIWGDWSI